MFSLSAILYEIIVQTYYRYNQNKSNVYPSRVINKFFIVLAPTCGANQSYSTCVQGECRPLKCEDKGKNLPCPRVKPEYCETGCICVEGYLKNENGECVPEDLCNRQLNFFISSYKHLSDGSGHYQSAALDSEEEQIVFFPLNIEDQSDQHILNIYLRIIVGDTVAYHRLQSWPTVCFCNIFKKVCIFVRVQGKV